MRITVFLILCSILQSIASEAYSQRTRFSLDFSETKLATVLDEIETRSEFFFLFNEKLVDTDRKVTQTFRNQRVEEILDILFEETDVVYTITDRKIILAPSYLSEKQQPQNSVSGKVTDESGQPLPGVSVVIKGESRGMVTDMNGNYSISGISENAILVFSFIGMKTQEIVVGKQNTINITLKQDFIGLDEVVAIGYGTIKKADVTGSVAKVRIEDIENRVVSRLDDALQGKMAGVMIQQNSGLPGAAPVVRIRGTNSITEGNQPLWVIDGMPVEEAKVIGNINMSDVESIEVLKDAASAAIYGSRGASGVILVTTKKGKAGSPKFSFNMYYGSQKEEKRTELMTGPEAAAVYTERREWQLTQDSRYDKNTPNDNRPAFLRIDPNWLTGNVPTNDFQDLVFRSAPIQSYNLSFSGGTDKSTYYSSMEYMNDQGIITNTSFEKYSFRINLESQIHKRIKIGLDLSPSLSTQMDNNAEGKDQTISLLSYTPSFADPSDIYWDEGGRIWINDYMRYYGLNGYQGTYGLNNLKQEYKRNQILSRAFIDVSIMNGLTARSQLHFMQSNMKFNNYQNVTLSSGGGANATIANEYNTNLTWENTLNYVKEIDKHSINGLLGYSMQKDFYEYSTFQGRDFSNELVLTLNNAARISSWNQNIQEWSMISMFARANYTYNSRYMLSASIRGDGSSRFGSENKWGYFPAVSVGWRISEESFMKSQELFSMLKLRGSYGATGNNRIGNYRPYATLNSNLYPLGSNESLVSGLVPGSFENQKLTWEKSVTTNLGLDIGILNNKIILAIDAYNSNTDGLLLAVPVPFTTGYSSAIQNVGKVNNKGIEMEISTRNIETSDFKWSTNFNFGYNKNEVKEMGPDGAPILNGPFWASGASYTGIGYPIGSFYLWEADGIFMTQEEVDNSARYSNEGVGDVKWVDQNGDKKIDALDRKVVGQPTPKYNFGFTNNFSYKGFDLSVFINGSGGHYTYFGTYRYNSRPTTYMNLKEWVYRYKSPSEPGNGIVPRVTSNSPTNGLVEESTSHLYKSDWWRIKNVALGYNFSHATLQTLKIASLKIYVSGDNLFLKTNYLGYNPEGALTFAPNQGTSQREAFSASKDLGYDYGSSPLAKRFIVGLNITF